jgi:penicillin-binding protein 2
MQPEVLQRKLLTRRTAILGAGQAVLFAALAERMYQLQVVEADRYVVLADENRINLQFLAPQRGRVLDRFGAALADNHQSYRLVVVVEQSGDITATLDALAGLIEIGEGDRRRVLRDIRRKHPFVPILVRGNLSWDEMARIEVAIPELPGIAIEQGLVRFYPLGEAAAHAVGYVAAVSEAELSGDPLLELPDFRIGKSGIEKSQDAELRGRAGTSQVEVNAFGRVVRELVRVPGKPGIDIVSCLDATMQNVLAHRCSTEESVASVLLDVATGDILALVSCPSFDPAPFATGLSPAVWQQLSADPRNPLTNKAIAGTYPPGSTFKPVVAAAALMTGILTPDTSISCPGYIQLGDTTFHCWRKGGHGSLRLRDAIKKSCDVFFYETARRLGIDRLAATARRFGFGGIIGLDIPGERPGLIPSREWKLATAGTAWSPGETVIAGIGQGSVLATPLQIAIMVARLVTGRAVVPRLVRTEGVLASGGDPPPANFPELGVSPQELALILDGMDAVVNEQGGTAYAERITDPGFAMGGKSGTSQVRVITAYEHEHGLRKISQIPWKERDHALFVGFAPVGAPRYVCATVVEHGGVRGGHGSEVAGPICRDVLREVQRRDLARHTPGGNTVAQLPTLDRSPPPRTNGPGG